MLLLSLLFRCFYAEVGGPKPNETEIRTCIPEKLEAIIEQQVGKRIIIAQNKELVSVFQVEMTRQVNARLASRRAISKQTKDNLKVKSLANPFAALQGSWTIPCSQCGDKLGHSLTLDSYNIQRLLLGKKLSIESSPLMARLKGPHTVRVSLEDIVELYLDHEPFRG